MPLDELLPTDTASAAFADSATSVPHDIPTQAEDGTPDATNKGIGKFFQDRVAKSKQRRRRYIGEWRRNVDIRLGKIDVAEPETLQASVNPDWALTKTKTAALFSQVPKVRLQYDDPQFADALPVFARALNYVIGPKQGKIGVAMEEALNDIVNAAGIGGIYVGYAARHDTIQVPAIDLATLPPEVVAELQATNAVPMMDQQRKVSDKWIIARLSPPDILVPSDFTGSDFDDGAWIGRSGKLAWPVAKTEFRLTDDQREKVVGGGDRPLTDTLRNASDTHEYGDDNQVFFDEVFYWRYLVDSTELSFQTIWRLVFVDGLTEPAVHEPWTGQKLDDQTGQYIGSVRFPIRIGTTVYVSDTPIPPSDSAIGRPQVTDMQRSRSQMFMNRDRSIPVRWYDVNRVDPAIADNLQRGTWQGFIPTAGDGSRSIGEIARASYPAEDLSFDQQIKQDLMETWQIGPNQMGTTARGEKSATEANIVQTNFSSRIGQERDKIAALFLGVVDVVAGQLILNNDWPMLNDQERQRLLAVPWQQIYHGLVFDVLPDTMIKLDVETQIARVERVINFTAKSGMVDVAPLMKQYLELNGIDPAAVAPQPPPPQPPEKVNVSIKPEDFTNPIALAMLMKSGQAPSPEELTAAVKLIQTVGQILDTGVVPGEQPPGEPGMEQPPVEPPVEGPSPDWALMPKIAQRSEDVVQ